MRVIGFSVLFVTASLAHAASFVFTPFSGPEGATFVHLSGINNAGQIVGYDSTGAANTGFLRNSDGSYTTVAVPGKVNSYVNGINNAGELVGSSTDTLFGSAGAFTLSATGVLTNFGLPNQQSAEAGAVNNKGEVLVYGLTQPGPGYFYLRSADGSAYTPISTPTDPMLGGATLYSFNDAHEGAGAIGLTNSLPYVQSLDTGEYRVLNVPSQAGGATATGINDAGQVVGYTNAARGFGLQRGFLIDADGNNLQYIDYPGASSTLLFGINDLGQILGDYNDATGLHYFYATPETTDVPEPMGFSLLAVAVLLFAASKLRFW